MNQIEFDDFFRAATTNVPFDYQRRLAEGDGSGIAKSLLINVPTGSGKTDAVVLAWLWNSLIVATSRDRCPRRLVYCLPMRTLVEQTRRKIDTWLRRLLAKAEDIGLDTPSTHELQWLVDHSPIVLMGGEDIDANKRLWDIYPERPCILIGTQDMLLSRTLNRGYALSRRRWPMHFGLLNNDCLWVLDEVQLMGPGLGTACQLEAFRNRPGSSSQLGGEVRVANATWYLSATASRDLLISRDWRPEFGNQRPIKAEFVIQLGSADLKDRDGPLGRRRLAIKSLEVQSDWHLEDDTTPGRIVRCHFEMLSGVSNCQDLPRRTLIICNTVLKAGGVFKSIGKELAEYTDKPELLLLHSRFRRDDRDAIFHRIEHLSGGSLGQIVVATQVIEAGVDISAAALWTEVAPLPSIVQRLGRLNRAGEFGHDGNPNTGWIPKAYVVGVGAQSQAGKRENAEEKKKREAENAKRYRPYERRECEASATVLFDVGDAGPSNLEEILAKPLADALKPLVGAIQYHELLDFFDTDANLSMGYTDVSPFVRGSDPDPDVQVLWRCWQEDRPPFGSDIGSGEICPVAIWHLKKLTTWLQGFVWQGRERGWQPASERNLFAGAVLLLPVSAGGYSSVTGWTGAREDTLITDLYQPPALPNDADMLSMLGDQWESIGRHTHRVKAALESILSSLGIDANNDLGSALIEAAVWHDFGKNHPEWQEGVHRAAEQAGVIPKADQYPFGKFSLATSPALAGKTGRELRAAVYGLMRSFQPGLRHEVASSLALRQHHMREGNGRHTPNTPSLAGLLAEYVVMSHHGYVRKVLRNELPKSRKSGAVSYDEVRGIADGIQIEPVNIGDKTLTADPISIDCRNVGRCQDGSEGWTKGVLRLVDELGPFRLAYYEALFRAADWRASLKSPA